MAQPVVAMASFIFTALINRIIKDVTVVDDSLKLLSQLMKMADLRKSGHKCNAFWICCR